MKVISFNLNGLRSSLTKGLCQWVEAQDADIVCFQEVKADVTIAEKLLAEQFPEYQAFSCLAEKKGYSGVATLVRNALVPQVEVGCGVPAYDMEGRVVRVDLDKVSILNTYFPSGTTGEVRQAVKEEFMSFYRPYVSALRQRFPNLIVCGDFNIAHTPDDIHNPKNTKVSGFLPQERAWLSAFVSDGMLDSYRQVHPVGKAYTWWSQRAGSRAKNLGWRLDYHFVSDPLAAAIRGVGIHPEPILSDHCPVSVHLGLD